MNNVEEQLWNYIDGACSADERKAIELLIAQDAAYRNKYQELLSFNQELVKMEIDEPSMAFTYNVMEGIRAEHAQKPLKAAINKRIIWAVTGFFVFTIALMLIYILSSVHLTTSTGFTVQLPANFKIPDVKGYLNGPVIKAFLFFDVILGLFLGDAILRRRKVSKQL